MRTKLRANEPAAAASRAGSAQAAQLTVNVFYGFLSHWQTVTCTWRSFLLSIPFFSHYGRILSEVTFEFLSLCDLTNFLMENFKFQM